MTVSHSRPRRQPLLERAGAPAWLVGAGTGTTVGAMAYLALAAGGHWSAVAAYGGVAAVVLAVAALLRGVHRGVPTWGDALVAGGPAVWVLMLVGGLGLLPAAAGKVLAWAAHRAVPALAAAATAVVVVAHTAGPAVALAASTVSVVPGDTAPARRPRRPQTPRAPPARTPIAARRVNRGIPCPACGGTDECYFTSDLEHVVCTRVVSDRPVRDAIHGTAWLHPVRPGLHPLVTRTRRRPARDLAAAWLTPAPLHRSQRIAAEQALDTYMRSRGFPAGAETLGRAGVQMTIHRHVPWPAPLDDEPVYYYSYAIYRVDAVTDPAAAVLALTPAGAKAAIPAWGGDARRTYGPRPAGAVLDLHAIRGDVVSLPGLPDDGRRFVVGEGLETTLAGMAAVGGAGLACVDAGHMRSLLVAPTWRRLFADAGAHLVILVDTGDTIQAGHRAGAGDDAAAACLARAREAGIPALALRPPACYAHQTNHGPAADWADVLAQGGVEGVEQAAVEAATEAAAPSHLYHLPRLRRGPAAPARAIDPLLILGNLRIARHDLPGQVAAATLATGAVRTVLACATGTGKSTAFAAAAVEAGAALIAATTTERDRLARLSGAVAYPARSPDPASPGYCADWERVVKPLADRARGVALLACATCPLGQMAMQRIKSLREAHCPIPTSPNSVLVNEHMCPYIWHTERAREAEIAAATEAKLAGDPDGVSRRRESFGRRAPRPILADDCPDVVTEGIVTTDNIRGWVSTAPLQAAADDAEAARLDSPRRRESPDEARGRKAEARRLRARAAWLRAAQPHLQALAQVMADRAQDTEQTRLDPAPWADFAAMALDAAGTWQDATGAEAILRLADGTRSIPLRALADLARALGRGTAWHLRGAVRYMLPAPLVDLARTHQAPMVWATATPSSQLLRAAGAGVAGGGDAVPGNLWIVLHPESGHGKVACADRPQVEAANLIAAIRRHAPTLPLGSQVAVITHMALAQRIGKIWADDPEDSTIAQSGYTCSRLVPGYTVQIGWWGRHHRAQDAWRCATMLILWGVVQFSPATLERQFCGGEDAVAQAGAAADSTWDPGQAIHTYEVPGQPGTVWERDGYLRDDIDAYRRDWTTGETVQALGRLRGADRAEQVIPVHVYSTFPFTGNYGMHIDEIAAREWRSAEDYREAAHEAAVARVDRAATALRAAGQRVSQRTVAAWIRGRGGRTSERAYQTWLYLSADRAMHDEDTCTPILHHPAPAPAPGEHRITQSVGKIVAVRPVGPALNGAWQVRVLARRLRAVIAVARAASRARARGAG